MLWCCGAEAEVTSSSFVPKRPNTNTVIVRDPKPLSAEPGAACDQVPKESVNQPHSELAQGVCDSFQQDNNAPKTFADPTNPDTRGQSNSTAVGLHDQWLVAEPDTDRQTSRVQKTDDCSHSELVSPTTFFIADNAREENTGHANGEKQADPFTELAHTLDTLSLGDCQKSIPKEGFAIIDQGQRSSTDPYFSSTTNDIESLKFVAPLGLPDIANGEEPPKDPITINTRIIDGTSDLPEKYTLIDNTIIRKVNERWGMTYLPSPEMDLSYSGYARRVRAGEVGFQDSVIPDMEKCCRGRHKHDTMAVNRSKNGRRKKDRPSARQPPNIKIDKVIADLDGQLVAEEQRIIEEYQHVYTNLQRYKEMQIQSMKVQFRKEMQIAYMRMGTERTNRMLAAISQRQRLEMRKLCAQFDHAAKRLAMRCNELIGHIRRESASNKQQVYDAAEVYRKDMKLLQAADNPVSAGMPSEHSDEGEPLQDFVAVRLRYCNCKDRVKSISFLPENVASDIQTEDDMYDFFYTFQD